MPRPRTEHASDCALHNGPAYPAGPCDCGYELTAIERGGIWDGIPAWMVKRAYSLRQAQDDALGLTPAQIPFAIAPLGDARRRFLHEFIDARPHPHRRWDVRAGDPVWQRGFPANARATVTEICGGWYGYECTIPSGSLFEQWVRRYEFHRVCSTTAGRCIDWLARILSRIVERG